jgi:hypothetical protein
MTICRQTRAADNLMQAPGDYVNINQWRSHPQHFTSTQQLIAACAAKSLSVPCAMTEARMHTHDHMLLMSEVRVSAVAHITPVDKHST